MKNPHDLTARFFSLLLPLLSMAVGIHAQDNALLESDRLLVWIADGVSPGQHDINNPGQLAIIDGTGMITPVLDLPQGTTRVLACGDQSTSPDGQHFVFYVGDDLGTLYIMTGTDTLFPLDLDFHAMSCAGNGTFRFMPDSSQFAYLDYPPGANQAEAPTGTLRINSTSSYATESSFNSVAAFSLTDETVDLITYIANSQELATEAAIIQWDGEVDREVAALRSNENCHFISAAIHQLEDGRLIALMGQRCTIGDILRLWQIYMIDPANRSNTLMMQGVPDGQYFAFARTNTLIAAPDPNMLYFTVPDGFTNNTTDVFRIDLVNSILQFIVDNHAVMPRFSTNAYADDNHPPVASADGIWLGMSRNTPDNDASLYLADLARPELSIEIPAGERGDTIAEILFAPDSSQMVFVAGGSGGGNNSLFAVNLVTGSDFRVRRGRYAQGVMSPDGNQVAILNWQTIGEATDAAYTSLFVVDIESSQETLLFQGATIVNDEAENARFALPLAWWRAE